MSSEFKSVVDQIVVEIEGLRASIAPLMESVAFSMKFNAFLLNRFLETNGELVVDEGKGEKKYRIGPTHFGKVRRLERQFKSSAVAQSLVPSSLLVTLVSRYDAFLKRLIRTMVLTCPSLLKSSDRTLSLGSLIELGDFENAKEYLIEKEIEFVLRKSHGDQFSWLESTLNMKLREDLPSWQTFIELTERRNLIVHSDGIVSHQYLAICRDHSISVESCAVGQKLEVPPDYFRAACDCIVEFAVKLTHVVWRKLLPLDRKAADSALNQTCFELLIHENFLLAHELLRFATLILKKHASERYRLMFLVNLAQSLKWLDREAECRALLEKEDWTAKGLDFQLCVSVLQEKYSDSVAIMRQIGKDGFVNADAYRDWPIFRKARKDNTFQEGYKDVFGEEMQLGESVLPLKLSDIMDYIEELLRQNSESDGAKELSASSKPDPNEAHDVPPV